MASMFNTWAKLEHKTPIPEGVLATQAIEMLQNHEFYIKCDPHMIHYEPLDAPAESAELPSDRGVVALAPTTFFKVTDKVHALPAGLWDSDVVSTYQFTKVERGVFVKILSPLNVSMETLWEIRENESGQCEIVEDVLIKCSRLLMGTIKNTCEAGWEGIHAKMVASLQEDKA